MIGWHISVYKQVDGGHSPAPDESSSAQRFAVWQTGREGLEWLIELANSGNAIEYPGNGYPNRFTALAEFLVPRILAGPPLAKKVWGLDEYDSVDASWEGKTRIDEIEARKCRFDEWLLVEAWDES